MNSLSDYENVSHVHLTTLVNVKAPEVTTMKWCWLSDDLLLWQDQIRFLMHLYWENSGNVHFSITQAKILILERKYKSMRKSETNYETEL